MDGDAGHAANGDELMPTTNAISPQELKRLQTLYSQLAAASPDPRTRSREERLLWASLIVGRTVASFSELTSEEANTAIARLQRCQPFPVLGSRALVWIWRKN